MSGPKWEYCREFRSARSEMTTRELNDLGAEGWDLVTVMVLPGHSDYQHELVYLFKRSKDT